jgi:hypothetical protein
VRFYVAFTAERAEIIDPEKEIEKPVFIFKTSPAKIPEKNPKTTDA